MKTAINITKSIAIFSIVIQVILFVVGCYQLSVGKIYFGLWNTIINTVGILINISTLRSIAETDKLIRQMDEQINRLSSAKRGEGNREQEK